MASIKDVAQKAGVGVGTVSRVINGSGYVAVDTRKKIEQAISDLEYTPNELARNLFRNKTGIIGVLIPDLDHPFFSAFARETEVALYKRGYKAMICNTVGSSNRERDYLNMLDRNMVDGIITGAHTLHWKEYTNRKHTIVALDQDFGPEIPMVGSDHIYGGRLAAEIMIKNHCKRVVHITGTAPNVAANDRHVIFESTLKEHGIDALNNGCLLPVDHQIAVRPTVVAEEPVEGNRDLAVYKVLPLALGAVFRNAPAFLLRQRGHDGQEQLDLPVERPDILFFKIALDAVFLELADGG